MSEIELKLRAPADKLDDLRKALATLAGTAVPPAQTLAATYYDTTDRELQRKGIILRVRREGDKHIQTVKTTGKRLTKRGEWSDAVEDDALDLDAAKTGRRVRKLTKKRLRPQFEVNVKRTVVTFHAGGHSVIEAAVDEGVIHGPNKKKAADRVAEVELELKEGDAGALYTIALKLLSVAHLSIESRTKSMRGYALDDKGPPKEVRAELLKIDGDMTVEDVLRHAGRRYFTQCIRNTPAVLGDSVEGLHQMRVALRRLRALLQAFKGELPEDSFAWANDRLKRLQNGLGPARNWDVFVTEMIAPLKKKPGAPLDSASPFHRTVRIAQMRARLQARDAVASPSHTALLLELLRWFETRGWRASVLPHPKRLRKSIKSCAGKILTRQFDRARKRGQNFAKLPTEQRHKFRIALKNLRYTAELLQSVLKTKKIKQFIVDAKPLQDSLGHLNDVSTAQELVASLVEQDPTPAVARDGGIVLGWYERVAKAGDHRLCQRVAKFCGSKPAW